MYHAIHVRRGDFQQKHTRLPAEEIIANTRPLFDTSVTKLLYIATDEKNLSFLDPFRKEFVVKLLSDYLVEVFDYLFYILFSISMILQYLAL